MLFPVLVTSRKGFTKAENIKISRYRLQKTDKYTFSGNLSQSEYNSLCSYCAQNKINIEIINRFGTRGNGYRRNFFMAYKPVIGNYYVCAYCGKLVHKDRLTIDHLYPVGRVKRSAVLQKKLMKLGYESVNDVRNLVPSCDRCNYKKAARMGIWIIKGKIGRHPFVWLVRHIIRICILWYIFLIFFTGTYKTYIDFIKAAIPESTVFFQFIFSLFLFVKGFVAEMLLKIKGCIA